MRLFDVCVHCFQLKRTIYDVNALQIHSLCVNCGKTLGYDSNGSVEKNKQYQTALYKKKYQTNPCKKKSNGSV